MQWEGLYKGEKFLQGRGREIVKRIEIVEHLPVLRTWTLFKNIVFLAKPKKVLFPHLGSVWDCLFCCNWNFFTESTVDNTKKKKKN